MRASNPALTRIGSPAAEEGIPKHYGPPAPVPSLWAPLSRHNSPGTDAIGVQTALPSPSARVPPRLTLVPWVTHNLSAHGQVRNGFDGAVRSVPGAVGPYVSHAPGHAADQLHAYRQFENREGARARRAADHIASPALRGELSQVASGRYGLSNGFTNLSRHARHHFRTFRLFVLVSLGMRSAVEAGTRTGCLELSVHLGGKQ